MSNITKCPKCDRQVQVTEENAHRVDEKTVQVVCGACGFTFTRKVRGQSKIEDVPATNSETAGARHNQPRSAPPSSALNSVAAVHSPGKASSDPLPAATVPERIRSKLCEILPVLAGMSPHALHAELTGLVADLSKLLPENVRRVETGVLDNKLDDLLVLTEQASHKSKARLGAVEQSIKDSAAILRERLKVDSASSSEHFRSLTAAIDKLTESVTSSAETAGKSLASSSAVQAIEERLASAVRHEIDSFLGMDRVVRMDHVLELFDILAGYRDFWEMGQKMTPAEEDSRGEVTSVLREIASRMDHWADIERLEPFPARDAGHVEFDEMWHRRVNVEPTSDAELAGRIAVVERVGYQWKGGRLRKADVVVYKYSPPPEPLAASSGGGDHEQFSND